MPPAWIGTLNAMVKSIVAVVTMVTGLHLATQWCTKESTSLPENYLLWCLKGGNKVCGMASNMNLGDLGPFGS